MSPQWWLSDTCDEDIWDIVVRTNKQNGTVLKDISELKR